MVERHRPAVPFYVDQLRGLIEEYAAATQSPLAAASCATSTASCPASGRSCRRRCSTSSTVPVSEAVPAVALTA
jgi:hypothetical protein